MSSTVASFGMLMVLEMAPEMNGCAAAIMRMWPSTGDSACRCGRTVGAVEHGIVLGLQVRRAFDGHGAADIDVGGVDLAPGESENGQQVEARRGEVVLLDAEFVAQELVAQRPVVEDELDVEGGRQRLFHLVERGLGEALGLERG